MKEACGECPISAFCIAKQDWHDPDLTDELFEKAMEDLDLILSPHAGVLDSKIFNCRVNNSDNCPLTERFFSNIAGVIAEIKGVSLFQDLQN